MLKQVVCGVVLTCAVLPAMNVEAQPLVRSERVVYDDLNLSTDAGLRALHGRVRAAARKVCALPGEHLARRGEASSCEQAAERRAHDRIAGVTAARRSSIAP